MMHFTSPGFKDSLDNTIVKNSTSKKLVATLVGGTLVSDKLQDLTGETVGRVRNLMINVDDGSLEYVVVEFEPSLKMGDRMFAIPGHDLFLNDVTSSFILDTAQENFRNMPGFSTRDWPQANDDSYYAKVDQYWSRAERRGIF